MRCRRPLLAVLAAIVAMGCSLVDNLTSPKSLSIQKFTATPDAVSAGTLSVMVTTPPCSATRAPLPFRWGR